MCRPFCGSAGALFVLVVGLAVLTATTRAAGKARPRAPRRGPLDPRGKVHVPIGIANAVDTLKTFVEAEGAFSPGFATYGVFFWLWDGRTGKLTAGTMDGVRCDHGLTEPGYLMPWVSWQAGTLTVRIELCQVVCVSSGRRGQVVAAGVHVTNRGKADRKVSLYAALRPLGPAGGPVGKLAVGEAGDALLVDGHPALVALGQPDAAGVLETDTITDAALAGKVPGGRRATSKEGDCSGAMRFDRTVKAGATEVLGFVCPVLPGRRAVGHKWDGVSRWAQLDLAEPNPPTGGRPQPDLGLAFYRGLRAGELLEHARRYWKDLVGRAEVALPDRRWTEAFGAILGHAAMSMNEGAPDVAVVNYNVFNRDGVYVVNMLQKAGRFDLAAEAIDYFLAHPFNGRIYPEADNPGQILWVMGEHWRFTRDRKWLGRVYPSARKLAALVRHYRTAPGPHYVALDSLDFGEALPAGRRKVLEPGRCDGHHPEYTEAFDIAGLRGACVLAAAAGRKDDADACGRLVERLFTAYDERFGKRLPRSYGSYSVLWPCRLYPLGEGKAHEAFRRIGAKRPGGWRYFPLATAHQGLLAGRRDAGHGTLAAHLKHPQMHGWYAFDEGGRSGPGGWRHARTTWQAGVAMPHGWAVAELWLLLRDSLLFEDGERLVLLAGVPPAWLAGGKGLSLRKLQTHFGACSLRYAPTAGGATLTLTGTARPPGGFVLRLGAELKADAVADGRPVRQAASGDVALPASTKKLRLTWRGR